MALLLALPFLTVLGKAHFRYVDWHAAHGWLWLAIVGSGSLSTGVTIAIWNNSVKAVGPAHTAVYGSLVPVVALLTGVILLGEAITPAQIVGGALILGGLFYLRRRRKRRTLQPAGLATNRQDMHHVGRGTATFQSEAG